MTNYIVPVDRTKLAEDVRAAETALDKLLATPCTSAAHDELLGQIQSLAHAEIKAIEEERLDHVRPLNAAVDELNALYRPPRTAWEKVKDCCRQKREDYRTQQRRLSDEARERALLAAEAGKTAECAAALATVEDVGGSFEWTAETINFDLIPSWLKMVNEKQLKKYCSEHAKSEVIPPVPGLKFTRRAVVRVGKIK